MWSEKNLADVKSCWHSPQVRILRPGVFEDPHSEGFINCFRTSGWALKSRLYHCISVRFFKKWDSLNVLGKFGIEASVLLLEYNLLWSELEPSFKVVASLLEDFSSTLAVCRYFCISLTIDIDDLLSSPLSSPSLSSLLPLDISLISQEAKFDPDLRVERSNSSLEALDSCLEGLDSCLEDSDFDLDPPDSKFEASDSFFDAKHSSSKTPASCMEYSDSSLEAPVSSLVWSVWRLEASMYF